MSRKRSTSETPDKSFTYAGAFPIQHRDTGEGCPAWSPTETDDLTSSTELHECSDLLREWGVE